jgi:hypothetical protein
VADALAPRVAEVQAINARGIEQQKEARKTRYELREEVSKREEFLGSEPALAP